MEFLGTKNVGPCSSHHPDPPTPVPIGCRRGHAHGGHVVAQRLRHLGGSSLKKELSGLTECWVEWYSELAQVIPVISTKKTKWKTSFL